MHLNVKKIVAVKTFLIIYREKQNSFKIELIKLWREAVGSLLVFYWIHYNLKRFNIDF